MKLTIIIDFTDSFKWAVTRAIGTGCENHGDSVEILDLNKDAHGLDALQVAKPDAVCCWGWGKAARQQNKLGRNVLVVERAYLADRFMWVSLGWNGLNGRAKFPVPNDGGNRWKKHFASLLCPWRANNVGYALLMGQVPDDYAVRNINFENWAKAITNELGQLGHQVRFRPHPAARQVKTQGLQATGTLQEALAGAAFAVTWNSNSGVDAVISGTPTVTMDKGAMAWDVTSHDFDCPIITPDREMWAHRMAFTQCLPLEIEQGEAWSHLRKLV